MIVEEVPIGIVFHICCYKIIYWLNIYGIIISFPNIMSYFDIFNHFSSTTRLLKYELNPASFCLFSSFSPCNDNVVQIWLYV